MSINRREFIKRAVGAVGLTAALSSPLMPVIRKARATGDDSEGAPPEKKRKWVMVIDLKKCDGCIGLGIQPQCMKACIQGHYVPKGQKWIEIFEDDLPGGGTYFLPTPCYHCDNAPCVNVCPVAATYHTESGVVLIDQRRCIGCRMCMAACPYHRRFFNWGTPELPPEAALAEYSPEHQVPAIKGTVMKCDFCPDMMQQGRLPFCVTACPRKVLYMGDLTDDLASNGAEVVKLSRFLGDNDAFRYKEGLGTQPNVYYLPGHGQLSGRKPEDGRDLFPTTWDWGGKGYDRTFNFWPPGEAE